MERGIREPWNKNTSLKLESSSFVPKETILGYEFSEIFYPSCLHKGKTTHTASEMIGSDSPILIYIRILLCVYAVNCHYIIIKNIFFLSNWCGCLSIWAYMQATPLTDMCWCQHFHSSYFNLINIIFFKYKLTTHMILFHSKSNVTFPA